MSATPSPRPLSPTVEGVIRRIQDRVFAARLKQVYLAAAHAIDKLSDIDLVKYETSDVEETADLSLWEEMAPVIGATVMDVNELLSVIRREFSTEPQGGIADLLQEAVEEASKEIDADNYRRATEAEAVLKDSAQQLAEQISQLGERMRSPSVVSDRWNLLTEVQTFRTRFREQIGNLVYLTAITFSELHRKDVVPGYEDEVKAAVTVRATVADLTRVILNRAEKIRAADSEDLQFEAQQLLKEMDVFGRTPAYRALRAQDKRQVLESRQNIGKVALMPTPAKEALLGVLEPFTAFIDSLSQVNNREILQTHDREVWAAVGVKLEQADQLAEFDADSAAQALTEAVATAQGLYGRSPPLDQFLRRAKKAAMPTETEELRAEAERLRLLLSEVGVS